MDGPLLVTTIVNAVSWPTRPFPVWVLVTATSAFCVTVTVSVEVSLPGFGSVVGDETRAVLGSAPAGAPASIIVRSVTTGASVFAWNGPGSVQVRSWSTFEHVQPPSAPSSTRPAGSVSVMVVVPVTSDGPWLRTARVHVTCLCGCRP